MGADVPPGEGHTLYLRGDSDIICLPDNCQSWNPQLLKQRARIFWLKKNGLQDPGDFDTRPSRKPFYHLPGQFGAPFQEAPGIERAGRLCPVKLLKGSHAFL